MDSIFKYINFRTFLNDYYAMMKESAPYFSYRWFAEKSGTNSPAFLKQVIQGKRNLTPLVVEKFLNALDLSKKEAEYFRVLVRFNQSKTAIEKQKEYAQMLTMADFIEEHQLDADQYQYYTHWYNSVVREVVSLHNGPITFEEISQKVIPTIKVREAKKSIGLLLRLNLISRDKQGNYSQNNKAITSGSDTSQMQMIARRNFHKQMIQLAGEALNRFPINERHATGMTLGVSQACYEVLLEEFSAFRERIVSIVDNDQRSEKVCQLNLQLFPVSQNLLSDLDKTTGEFNEK